MATIIDGKEIAASVIAKVTEAAALLEKETGIKPGLAVVIVGNDPASHAYVNSKNRMAKQCGFNSIQHTLPDETSQEELERLVAELNADPAVHGILVQLPLPKHLVSNVSRIAALRTVLGLCSVWHVFNRRVLCVPGGRADCRAVSFCCASVRLRSGLSSAATSQAATQKAILWLRCRWLAALSHVSASYSVSCLSRGALNMPPSCLARHCSSESGMD